MGRVDEIESEHKNRDERDEVGILVIELRRKPLGNKNRDGDDRPQNR